MLPRWCRGGLVIAVAPALAFNPAFAWIITFATLVPMSLTILIFTLVAVFGGSRSRMVALLVAVPPSLMMHGSVPLLLLTIVLLLEARTPEPMQIFRVICVFCGAYSLGVGAIFLLNGLHHGVFGVSPEAWRIPDDLQDVPRFVRGLTMVGRSLDELWTLIAVKPGLFWPCCAGMLVCAVSLAKSDRGAGAVIFVAVGFVLSVAVAQQIATGVGLPFRGWLFLWPPLVGIAAVVAAQDCPALLRVAGVATVSAMMLLGAVHWVAVDGQYQPANPETAALSREITANVREGTQPVYVVGERVAFQDYAHSEEADWWMLWLGYRLGTLLDRPVVTCVPQSEGCTVIRTHWAGLEPFPEELHREVRDMPQRPAEGWIRQRPDGVVLVRLADD